MLQEKITPENLALRIKDRTQKPIPVSPDNSDGTYNMEELGFKFKFKPGQYDPYTSWYTLARDGERDMRKSKILPSISRDSVCLDIGALCGAWTLPLLATGARVISIEPDPNFYQILCDNVVLNGFEKRWIGINCAVYDVNTTQDIYDMKDVSLRRLDSIDGITRTNLDFVKMDVEGAEIEVIQGGSAIWPRVNPTFWIECHDVAGPNIMKKVVYQLLKYYQNYVPEKYSLISDTTHLYFTPATRFAVLSALFSSQPTANVYGCVLDLLENCKKLSETIDMMNKQVSKMLFRGFID